MENNKKNALEWLESKGLEYEILEHDPVYTMEEMDAAGITAKGDVCKNLFLRDQKGKKHYLVVCPEEAHIDLSTLATQLRSTKLSFASPERLEKYLNVVQGCVSPLGVINDAAHEVVVAFDQKLQKTNRMGIHPNDNTATVWVKTAPLKKAIESLGNKVVYITTK